MSGGRQRYPLESLLAVRQAEEKTATEVLASRQRALEGAEHGVDESRSERARRRSSLEEEAAAQESALERGQATAAALANWQLVLGRLREALGQAQEALLAAQARVREEVAAVDEARQTLAEAIRARRAIEEHRAAFLKAEKAAQERTAEEILDEHAGRKRC